MWKLFMMPFFQVGNVVNSCKYLVEASKLDDLKEQGMIN